MLKNLKFEPRFSVFTTHFYSSASARPISAGTGRDETTGDTHTHSAMCTVLHKL